MSEEKLRTYNGTNRLLRTYFEVPRTFAIGHSAYGAEDS